MDSVPITHGGNTGWKSGCTCAPCDKQKRQYHTDVARHLLRTVTWCAWCSRFGTEERDPDGQHWHIDHIIPRVLGGSDKLNNLTKSCADCNQRKGSEIWGEDHEHIVRACWFEWINDAKRFARIRSLEAERQQRRRQVKVLDI